MDVTEFLTYIPDIKSFTSTHDIEEKHESDTDIFSEFPFLEDYIDKISIHDEYSPYMTLELEPEEYDQFLQTREIHSIVSAMERRISPNHEYTLCILVKEYFEGELYHITSEECAEEIIKGGFTLEKSFGAGDFGDGLYTFDEDSDKSMDAVYSWLIRDVFEYNQPDSLYGSGCTVVSFDFIGTIYRCVYGIDHEGYILVKADQIGNISNIGRDEIEYFDTL